MSGSTRRIAVAARELEGPPRGVARWLREVLDLWRETGRDRNITLYMEKGPPDGFETGAFELRITGSGPGGGATGWEQVALSDALRRDRPGVVLGPNNSIPAFARTPSVLVLHDISFEAHPEWFSYREGSRLRLLARWSSRRAKRILVVSEFTAREVAWRYGISRDRIEVVPNGISERFRPVVDQDELDRIRQRFNLGTGAQASEPATEIVLAVGSLFNRRHPVELLDGFALLTERHPTALLVIVGNDRTHPALHLRQKIDKMGIANRVRWIDQVTDDELVALYSTSGVCVYLSDYEGFGLPPLEALACATPVVASSGSSLEENLRGRATLLEPDDHRPEPIADALHDALVKARLGSSRPAWLDRFSWRTVADAVYRNLEEAAE